jgi:hypothetical protein
VLNPDLAKVAASSKKSKKSLSDNDNKNSVSHRQSDANILDVKDRPFERAKNSLPENVKTSIPNSKYQRLDESNQIAEKPKTHNRNKDKNGSLEPFTVTVSIMPF